MTSKKALSQTIPVIHGTIIGQPADDTSIKLGNVLQKIWQYLKGGNEDFKRLSFNLGFSQTPVLGTTP